MLLKKYQFTQKNQEQTAGRRRPLDSIHALKPAQRVHFNLRPIATWWLVETV